MTKDEALKLAMEAMEITGGFDIEINVIREALVDPSPNFNCKSVQARLATAWGYVKVQPEQEPVAWYRDEDGIRIYYETKCWDDAIPLYTAPQPWEKFCDSNCVWTDHHPDCKLAQPEPVACDGDFPEGFDASLGVPAQALRVANAIMCDVIGKREWDVPCTAQHVLLFSKKYTTPPQRTWVGLTLDERIELAQDVDWPAGAYCEYAEKIETKLKEKNVICKN